MSEFTLRPLSDATKEPIEGLFRGHPFLPFAYYPELPREKLEAYAISSARHLLALKDVEGFSWVPSASKSPESAYAVASYQPLEWDSRVLGMNAGRIPLFELSAAVRADRGLAMQAASELASGVMEKIRAAGATYVFARVDARDIPVAMSLQQQGFRVVDGILKFAFDLGNGLPEAPPSLLPIRDAALPDIPALRRMAESAFVYDRFHNDPVIPPSTADRLHGEWVENATRGRFGRGVLVAEDGDGIAGFSMLTDDSLSREIFGLGIGTHILLAVERKYRRQGLSKALFVAMMARLGELGNRFVESGTQIANVPSFNMHLALGYHLVHTSLSLRWTAEAASATGAKVGG